jgi:hypothetical protein
LTEAMKLKRHEIGKVFKGDIEELYKVTHAPPLERGEARRGCESAVIMTHVLTLYMLPPPVACLICRLPLTSS